MSGSVARDWADTKALRRARFTAEEKLRFDRLCEIEPSDLRKLAVRIRQEAKHESTNYSEVVETRKTNRHLSHVVNLDDSIKLVIYLPGYGWNGTLTPDSRDALRSHVAVLKFLEQHTTIPAPKVYGFDVTPENEIGVPFICWEHLPGFLLSAGQTWYTDYGRNPARLEECRLNTLTDLAQMMAQFRNFNFDKFGRLMESENGEFSVGPIYAAETGITGRYCMVAAGPYNSLNDFVKDEVERSQLYTKGENKVLDVLWDNLPMGTGLVFSHPTINARDILVDDSGRITGILNWDRHDTAPESLGWASYPALIAADWDPLNYNPPEPAEDDAISVTTTTAGSVEDLTLDENDRLRAHYLAELTKASGGHPNMRWAAKSHIRNAVVSAIIDPELRKGVCEKVLEEVKAVTGWHDLAIHTGADGYSDADWARLEPELVKLVQEN